MGILARWFGRCGTVRFEGVTVDGQEFTGTTNVELFNSSMAELEDKLKNAIYVETGSKIESLHIVAFVEK
jgi:hypothetical protein